MFFRKRKNQEDNVKVNNKHNMLIEECDNEEEEDEEMKYYEMKKEGLEEKCDENEVECENEHHAGKKEDLCSDVTMKEDDECNSFFDAIFTALVDELKEDLEIAMLGRRVGVKDR